MGPVFVAVVVVNKFYEVEVNQLVLPLSLVLELTKDIHDCKRVWLL